jgi:diguanylate cyclase (GGDEF)-like protein
MAAITRTMRGFGAVAAALIALYPVLPDLGRAVVFLGVSLASLVVLIRGRRIVAAGKRLPWTLLCSALILILVAAAVAMLPTTWASTVSWLLDAVGNIFIFAAALAFILRRGPNDLGGIVDTSIVSLAAGGLLWGVGLPHRQGLDDSLAAQFDLFVAVYALTGVFGALLRLCRLPTNRGAAIWLLMAALGLAIGANVTHAVAGGSTSLPVLAEMLFIAAFATVGLFGLDPTAPSLAQPDTSPRPERLTLARLVFLGVAVAVMPVVIGFRQMMGANVDGLLLAVQGALVAALVMVRIGLLSAQRSHAEEALQHQATHDPLTHLPNRRQFVDRLTTELANGRRCLLLFCDLDDFKQINDKFGHDTGDQVLVEVARRLEAATRPNDVVSRFGGDEFVILMTDATPADGEAVATRIGELLAQPFAEAGGLSVGASIGLSFTSGVSDPEDLIRSADRAMYQVKATHTATR